MKATSYTIHKGVNRSVEFTGLKAQYIWWLGGGVLAVLVLFAILYIAGLSPYLCIVVALGSLGGLLSAVMRMSKRYGEFGLMKKQAQRKVPRAIRSRSRRVFVKKINQL
jgi:hypothetical protein